MGIYIPKIEPPTGCRDCPYAEHILRTGITRCKITETILAWQYKPIPIAGRAPDCPIIEVSPHDLVDIERLQTVIESE